MAVTNRKIVLARRPTGMPKLDEFRIEEDPVPELSAGQVHVATEHLSIDAFIRTTLEERSFHPSVPIGGVVSGLGVGRVVESADPGFVRGDGVVGPLGAQTHAVLPSTLLQKVDDKRLPLRAYLGLLGLTTGLTAWFGVHAVGAVSRGETFVVSAAAGAAGSVAGQLARRAGARVIGIAGGAAKQAYLRELGFDASIDYKGEDVAERLGVLAPEGVDVYFDNVGGELLDVVLDRIRERARIVICGAISQYQQMDRVRGPSLYLRLAERQARMEGFAVTHFTDRFPEAAADLVAAVEAGKLALPEHVEQGIERFPAALLMLFEGGHMGKLLVEV